LDLVHFLCGPQLSVLQLNVDLASGNVDAAGGKMGAGVFPEMTHVLL
jgi:hypothetical protein